MVGGVQQESCIKEFVYRIATVPLSRRVHIHTHPNMSHLSVPPSFPPSHHPLTTLSPSHALDLSPSHHHISHTPSCIKSLSEESLEEKSTTPTSPTSPSGGSGALTISIDGSEGVMGDGKATTAELLEAFTTQVEVFEGSMQEDGESIRREGGRRDRENRENREI